MDAEILRIADVLEKSANVLDYRADEIPDINQTLSIQGQASVIRTELTELRRLVEIHQADQDDFDRVADSGEFNK